MSGHPLPATTRRVELVRDPNGTYTRRIVNVPLPVPGDGEVLLHVRAASIQRAEIEIPTMLPPDTDFTGRIVGSDVAGDVVSTGARVRSVAAGQKVLTQFFPHYNERPLSPQSKNGALGYLADGVFGDYVVVEEAALAPAPESLSYEEAATLPSSPLTAWVALGGLESPRAGQTVVIEGTGGVSTFALQFAIAAGATVIVASSSDDKLARCLALGAKHGINYRSTPEWGARVLELTGGRGADLIVDVGGRATLDQAAACAAYEGTIAIVGGLGGYDGSVAGWPVMDKALVVRGVVAGPRPEFGRMCSFMAQHRIRPIIDRIYDFEEIETAIAALGAGQVFGKLVLRL